MVMKVTSGFLALHQVLSNWHLKDSQSAEPFFVGLDFSGACLSRTSVLSCTYCSVRQRKSRSFDVTVSARRGPLFLMDLAFQTTQCESTRIEGYISTQ